MFYTNKQQAFKQLSPLFLPWFFIIAGLILTLLQSFNFFVPLTEGSRGVAYLKVLGNIHIWQSLGFSLNIALVSAFLSTITGFSIALIFWRLTGLWSRLVPVYKILLILPHISVAYITILIFSQTGLLSSLLYHLGISDDFRAFPVLVFDNKGIGIVLGYLLKEIPFVILMISAHLQKIPEQMMQTARMLGAGKLYSVRRIVIPSALPSLISTFLILFLYSFGGFEMPFILGGSKPAMISITVYDFLFRKGLGYRAEAMVILIVILVISLLVLLLLFKLSRLFHIRKLLL